MEYTIKLTEGCNMSCSFCLQEHLNKHASIDSISNFLNQMEIDGITDLKLHGGEPLLRKKEIEFISNHKNAHTYSVRCLTNLTLLDMDYLKIFDKFKNVTFITNLEIFQSKNFFKTDKWKKVLMLKNSKFKIQTHTLIDKKEIKNIHLYKERILKHSKELEELKTMFDLEYPVYTDYSPQDLYNAYLFYDDMIKQGFNIYADVQLSFHKYFSHRTKQNSCCILGSEKAMDIDGSIKPCTCFMGFKKYTPAEIEKIEEDSKKCNECIFNHICRSCKYNYLGTNNRLFKCERIKRQIQAAKMYFINKEKWRYKTKKYSFEISIGNQCNKSCDFCFQNKKNNAVTKPEEFKQFLENNSLKLYGIGKLIGGEPTILLNDKWQFMFNYVDEPVFIFSNGYVKNDFIINNDFQICISIHSKEDLKKIQWEYYRKKITMIGVLLNEDNLKNIDEILFFIKKEFPNTFIKFQEVHSSISDKYLFIPNRKDIEKLINCLRLFPDLLEDFKTERIYENKLSCFESKIAIEKDKIILCPIFYECDELIREDLDYSILSKNIKDFKINDEDFKRRVDFLKEKYPNKKYDCIAKSNFFYAENKIYEMIRKEFNL